MSTMNSNGFTPWPQKEIDSYLAKGIWQNQAIYQGVQQQAQVNPEGIAIIAEGKQLSYAELWQNIEYLAKGFLELGLRANETCVLHLPNIVEFYLSFFALLRIGVRPVMALPAHRYSELSYFVEFTQASSIITSDQLTWSCDDVYRQLIDEHHCLRFPIVVENKEKGAYNRISTLLQLGKNSQKVLPSELTIVKKDIAFFQLSGGTTGAPKLIPRTHNDYVYSVRMSNEVCQFEKNTRYLCVLPAAHNFPLSSPGALGVFLAGGTVILAPDPSPQTVCQLIQQHKITVTALVPPLVIVILDYLTQNPQSLSSLEYIQVGGARLSEQVARRIQPELGCQLMQVFGMAEGLVNYTRLDDDFDEIIHSQGRPMSEWDDIKIVDEKGEAVQQGEAGILLTKGPYTIRGYFNAPEHNARSFNNDGYYITGDVVRLTSQGNLQVIGRDKDQINRGGEKIAAEEIENHLLAHGQVNNVALVGLEDDTFGEKSCAVIQAQQPYPKVFELKRFLRQRQLADFKIPDRVEFVDQLPKTPVGKVDKKRLKAQLQEQGA